MLQLTAQQFTSENPKNQDPTPATRNVLVQRDKVCVPRTPKNQDPTPATRRPTPTEIVGQLLRASDLGARVQLGQTQVVEGISCFSRLAERISWSV